MLGHASVVAVPRRAFASPTRRPARLSGLRGERGERGELGELWAAGARGKGSERAVLLCSSPPPPPCRSPPLVTALHRGERSLTSPGDQEDSSAPVDSSSTTLAPFRAPLPASRRSPLPSCFRFSLPPPPSSCRTPLPRPPSTRSIWEQTSIFQRTSISNTSSTGLRRRPSSSTKSRPCLSTKAWFANPRIRRSCTPTSYRRPRLSRCSRRRSLLGRTKFGVDVKTCSRAKFKVKSVARARAEVRARIRARARVGTRANSEIQG